MEITLGDIETQTGELSLRTIITKLENFNPARLAATPEEAYPSKDRPRGKDDISSVKFWIKELQSGTWKEPVILRQGSKITLLDGAHRIVAWNIQHKHKDIPVLFIKPKI